MRIQPAGNPLLLRKLYVDGLPPGCSTGWANVDRHYTVGPAQFTVVTGVPNHGKSEWLDALLVNLLDRPLNGKDWRFLVCSPENWPVELHESKLLEKISGKPFGRDRNGRMSWEEADDLAKGILQERFCFAELEERDTFGDLLLASREFVLQNKQFQSGIVLDPWNQLEHNRPPYMQETEYISEALSAAIRITRKTGAHLWIVAHPQKLFVDKKTGKRPIPTPYDISGSAHWFNKADNCITIYRDVEEPGSAVQIHTQKVRFKHIGRPGLSFLHYEPGNGRYSYAGDTHANRKDERYATS